MLESNCNSSKRRRVSEETISEMFCNSIDINNLEYRQLIQNKNGGRMVQVSTVPGSGDWNNKIRFQMSEDDKTNLQTTVWPLSSPMQNQDANRRTLELTIESPDLMTFLTSLDEKNIEMATSKSEEWFKKPLSKSDVERNYNYIVKPPNTPGDRATVKVKVTLGDTRPTNIYVVNSADKDGNITYEPGSAKDLTRGIKVLVIVETTGMWFMRSQFGMSLNATEILVWPQQRNKGGIGAFTLSTQLRLKTPDEAVDEEGMEL